MDKKRGIKNVAVSIVFKILILLGTLLVRRLLISELGDAVNGLNSLYTTVIGSMSVAELGVGSVITYCMYKPIVEGDDDKVAALYRLFSRLYLVIGGVILVCGCVFMAFLPYLAKGYAEADTNLYLSFALMLASILVSYAFSAKSSLINAYKNNYVTTTITSVGMLLQQGLQVAVLFTFRSFEIFLACAIVSTLFQWLVTEIVTRREYSAILKNKQQADRATRREVSRNVRAIFMHKIGSVLVNTADSVIISAFIGIVIVGKYSNYTTIMMAMVSVISLFFTPLTSVIGHLCVEEKDAVKPYFEFFHTFNFVLGLVFFLGYYAIIDELVTFCFGGGGELEMARSVSFVITVNYFIQFMRQAVLLFRDATGTFYYDRWKPLAEGVINVILSVAFVLLFGSEENGVVGVIVATIITNIFICHIVEPYVLHRHVFECSAKKYYLKNYALIALFVAMLFVLHVCRVELASPVATLLLASPVATLFANGFIAVGLALIPIAFVTAVDKNFRSHLGWLGRKLNGLIKKLRHSSPETEGGGDDGPRP